MADKNNKKSAYSYVAGYIFGTILMCCGASVIIALTAKLILWMF